MLSEITDRTIVRRTISDDHQQERLAERGACPSVVATTLGMYRAARFNEFAAVDPLPAELIDRPPVTLCDVALCDVLTEHHHADHP